MKATLFALGEKHYQASLTYALLKQDIQLDLICSTELENFLKIDSSNLNVLNLRGSGDTKANLLQKIIRVIRFYIRLVLYTIRTDSKIFHIQWDNKILFIDRVVLLFFYHVMGKKVIYTAHNVDNFGRYGKTPLINRVTLSYFYKKLDHIIVHTQKSKDELSNTYPNSSHKISVVPHGINLQVPNTELDQAAARKKLDIDINKKVLLFFGGIDPYKGVELLLEAFNEISSTKEDFYLIVVGRPHNCKKYVDYLLNFINSNSLQKKIFLKLAFIPDSEIELYFKAADCVVLPYKKIYQSGVLFLAYGFGLPVIANNVGNFDEDIINEKTGYVCYENTAQDLANKIIYFFNSGLFRNRAQTSIFIKNYAKEKYSWDVIASQTVKLYKYMLNF